jgi:hypothetical protein
MPLSNAERQARYRARIKEKLKGAAARSTAPTADLACLSSEEAAARLAFLADPAVATGGGESPPRRFMGLTRDEWARAPDELAAHFGLSEAVAGWRRRRTSTEAAGRSSGSEGWVVAEHRPPAEPATEEIPRWLRRNEPL